MLLCGGFSLLLGGFLTFTGHVALLVAIIAMRGRFRMVREIQVFQLNRDLVPKHCPLFVRVVPLISDSVPEVYVVIPDCLKLVQAGEISYVFLVGQQ